MNSAPKEVFAKLFLGAALFVAWTSACAQSPQTVFLVHGILQDGGPNGGLGSFARNLQAALDESAGRGRFIVDADFDFRWCANRTDCQADCTIGGTAPGSLVNNGARLLGAHINSRNPEGDVVVIGYSMGGLIARDMILNGFSRHRVGVLITLGTPHLGYPFEDINVLAACPFLAVQMSGDFISGAPDDLILEDDEGRDAFVSSYLHLLNTRWSSAPPPQLPRVWAAAAGTYCDDRIRDASERGCSEESCRNDGVVCAQSAMVWPWVMRNGPTDVWDDPLHEYGHRDSRWSFFCLVRNPRFSLSNPPRNGDLMRFLVDHICAG